MLRKLIDEPIKTNKKKRNSIWESNEVDESNIDESTEQPIIKSTGKEPEYKKDKYKVMLVTDTKIIYKDKDGFNRFIERKANEKVGEFIET